ncbi:MAG: AmpG family muropeptide MFS transporter [Myxococcales bacterium FL481]|nr:MAG: AmpG family muropeptide MFS transporter [Myxococcales bacterium FL481]
MLPFLLDLGFTVTEIGLGMMGLALAVVGVPPSARRKRGGADGDPRPPHNPAEPG